MDLILWRHTEAREARDSQADADRPLTAKGERQARRVADWLNRHLPDSTRVLVSPTLRTQQTAETLGRKFKLVPALGRDRTVEALLTEARWPKAKEHVLVVGHQHTLGLTAAYLMAGATQAWAVRKGAVWWLRMHPHETGGEILLHAVQSPDRL